MANNNTRKRRRLLREAILSEVGPRKGRKSAGYEQAQRELSPSFKPSKQ